MIEIIFYPFFLKVRSFHPSIVDSCEKLTNYLKTLPPNEDVEAKSVSLHLIIHFFLLELNELLLLFFQS